MFDGFVLLVIMGCKHSLIERALAEDDFNIEHGVLAHLALNAEHQTADAHQLCVQ
jgi:hypothetical protein